MNLPPFLQCTFANACKNSHPHQTFDKKKEKTRNANTLEPKLKFLSHTLFFQEKLLNPLECLLSRKICLAVISRKMKINLLKTPKRYTFAIPLKTCRPLKGVSRYGFTK